jgi:hypothetical protein
MAFFDSAPPKNNVEVFWGCRLPLPAAADCVHCLLARLFVLLHQEFPGIMRNTPLATHAFPAERGLPG